MLLTRRRFGAGLLLSGLASSSCALGQSAVGGKISLTGLIQLPTEDWTRFDETVYTARTQDRADLMWRTNWTPAGDDFVSPRLDQVQMDARPYGRTRARVIMDGPSSPTALGYNPFSVTERPDGSKALKIQPKYVPPQDREKTFGYPIVSGVISTAGKNRTGKEREFYASTYSVTIYRGVRLPRRMWTEIWQYPRVNYGARSATELDVLETMRGIGLPRLWLSAHSDDDAWRQAIAQAPSRYDPHLTGWAGEKNVSLQYTGLASSDPHALHDFCVVKSPARVQWAVDGVVVLDLPTPQDYRTKLMHDIVDVSYGMELAEPTSDADLDFLEIGPIERYTFPGLSRVVWRQQEVGDGAQIPGAKRWSGEPSPTLLGR